VNIGILSESFDIPEVVKQRFTDEETEDNKEGDLKDFCRKHDGVVLVKLMLPLTIAAERDSLLSFPNIPMTSKIPTPWRPASARQKQRCSQLNVASKRNMPRFRDEIGSTRQ
jgi:hypothetical protein